MDQNSAAIASAIAAAGRIEAIPTLLKVLCESTEVRFAAVAAVSESSWVACAVQDDIQFGLKPDDQLPIQTTLCIESRRSRALRICAHIVRAHEGSLSVTSTCEEGTRKSLKSKIGHIVTQVRFD